MNVKQFVEGYKTTTKGKEEYAKKHIKKNYLPYAEKIAIGDRIVKVSLYAGDLVKVFKINTPVKTMFLNMAIIDAYSDIDFEFTVDEYDLLSESGAIEDLLSAIPDSEVALCATTVEAMIADEVENTRSLVSFIETKYEALKAVFDSLLQVVEELNISVNQIENKEE